MEERRIKTINRNMVMTKTHMGDYAFMSPNCLKLQKKGKGIIYRGGGGSLVSCSTSTPINHTVYFLQNTSCIRKPQVTSGGGGFDPLHPPPRSAPDLVKLRCIRIPALHTLRFFSPIGFRLFKVGTEFLHPFQYTLHLHKLNNSTKKT